jgi:hypothetical protein
VTAYPKSAAQEEIVVPLKSSPRPVFPARSSAELPRTTIPEVAVEACFGFAESRRTGNIEVTFHSSSPRQAAAAGQSPATPIFKSAPIAMHARPRPHAAMPTPQSDFDGDLRQVDAEAPVAADEGAIESLMADAPKEPPEELSGKPAGMTPLRTGMDVGLARIIDAWPRLPSKARTALAAALDLAQSPATSGNAGSPTATVPLAAASSRKAETAPATMPNRRRKRTKEE